MKFLMSICLLLALSSPARAIGPGEVGAEASVTTMAGNGSPGIADGPATGAAFLMPVAAAVDQDGSLLVADQAAQRIRRVANGLVSTVAGTGDLDGEFAQVEGGFADGRIESARFNQPSGIAVGQDRTIYVADQMNHCVRRIIGRFVSTYAGTCLKAGKDDGILSKARFQRPMAVAVAKSGEIFIADFGVGLREIANGSVKTLELPVAASRHFTGVAVSGHGDDLTVVVLEDNGLFFTIKPGVKASAHIYNGTEGGQFPRMYGIAAVNDYEFIATDLKQNLIRQLRLADPPFVSQPASTVVAGAIDGLSQNSGGFGDGAVSTAKFYSPLGVAVDAQTIYVCDSGNRRIRAIPLPDVRRPVGSNFDEFRPDPTTYRILVFGSSDTFWSTDFPHSIPGLLERGLTDDRPANGLSMNARVSAARLDEANFLSQVEYASTYAGDGQVRLVVMLLEADALETIAPTAHETRDPIAIRTLKEFKAKLESAGTALYVSVRGDPYVASQIDDIYDRNVNSKVESNPAKYRAENEEFEAVLNASGVAYGLDIARYLAYNERPDRVPLWSFEDTHENMNGRRFAATRLIAEIEAMHPWSATPAPSPNAAASGSP